MDFRTDPRLAADLPVVPARPVAEPYPLIALLARSALLRRDVRGAHPGLLLDLHLQLVDAAGGAPLAEVAVYLHQDSPAELRGVQLSDAQGRVHLRTLRPRPGLDGAAHIALQLCATHDGEVCAIAQLRLALPGLRRGDSAPPQPLLESPGLLRVPAPHGDPAGGQTLALALALSGLDHPLSPPTDDHHGTP